MMTEIAAGAIGLRMANTGVRRTDGAIRRGRLVASPSAEGGQDAFTCGMGAVAARYDPGADRRRLLGSGLAAWELSEV